MAKDISDRSSIERMLGVFRLGMSKNRSRLDMGYFSSIFKISPEFYFRDYFTTVGNSQSV